MTMIEIDRTNEEREELVKKWISDYWLWVLLVVLLAVGAVYGMNYYRQSKTKALNTTAAQMENILKQLQENKLDEAKAVLSDIQANHADTSFSAIATLSVAKKHFEAKQYTEATNNYDWLIQHAGDMAMRDLARLRKAKAQSSAKQYQQAIDTLSGIEGEGEQLTAKVLTGDIHMENKAFDKARAIFESIPQNEAGNSQAIQQRLDLLTIKQQKAVQ